MKTKFLAAFAATVMILSIAGCSKSSTNTTTANQTTAAVTSAESTIAQPATAADTTTTAQTQASTSQSTTAAPTTKAPTTAAPVTKAPTTQLTTTAVSTSTKAKTFTKAELAKFDGKNGSKAYIAYEGKVYDVTGPQWQNGVHYILSAGTDITAAYNFCFKHGSTIFDRFSIVGTYTG